LDDCISLDVDHPGARCTPSKNKIDEMLGTQKKKKKNIPGISENGTFHALTR
jgi:hypothetical protein